MKRQRCDISFKNFKKQKKPHKDFDYQEGSSPNGYNRSHGKYSELVPQNSLQNKSYNHLTPHYKKTIKSFQIKPQEDLNWKSEFVLDQALYRASPIHEKTISEVKLEAIGVIPDVNGSKLISHKKCFSNIIDQNLQKEINFEIAASLSRENDQNEDNSSYDDSKDRIYKAPKISDIAKVHLVNIKESKVLKQDITVKMPQVSEYFEKSFLNTSKQDIRNSLMRTFYLYSFRDDMTTGNFTNADKEEYEIVKFHSRSLEDLSKFDWSGSGGTQNQSDIGKVLFERLLIKRSQI